MFASPTRPSFRPARPRLRKNCETALCPLCFHAKLPAKLAFVPYPWASIGGLGGCVLYAAVSRLIRHSLFLSNVPWAAPLSHSMPGSIVNKTRKQKASMVVRYSSLLVVSWWCGLSLVVPRWCLAGGVSGGLLVVSQWCVADVVLDCCRGVPLLL